MLNLMSYTLGLYFRDGKLIIEFLNMVKVTRPFKTSIFKLGLQRKVRMQDDAR